VTAKPPLARLRTAETIWQELDAPYDLARVRAALGQVLLALGDGDGAALDFDAALRTFRDLGAEPDIHRVERIADRGASLPGGLSAREVEVLRMVAAGQTNRAIAAELGTQRADHRSSREQHLRQARGLVARIRDGVRRRTRPRLTPSTGREVPIGPRRAVWVVPRMRARPHTT
jgi:hypothetical protein